MMAVTDRNYRFPANLLLMTVVVTVMTMDLLCLPTWLAINKKKVGLDKDCWDRLCPWDLNQVQLSSGMGVMTVMKVMTMTS